MTRLEEIYQQLISHADEIGTDKPWVDFVENALSELEDAVAAEAMFDPDEHHENMMAMAVEQRIDEERENA